MEAEKKDLPPSSWSRNPGYKIDLEPVPARLRVELGGYTIADSERALVMYELGHAPVYYFPRQDVREELLSASDHRSHCPYKGDAGYFSVSTDGVTAENAVWFYDHPYEEMAHLKGLLGFYFDRFDAWYENGCKIDSPREVEGRVNERNNFAELHPKLAADWHPEKNAAIRPYEFSEHSDTVVWWKSVDNDEWQESIRSRVQHRRRRDAPGLRGGADKKPATNEHQRPVHPEGDDVMFSTTIAGSLPKPEWLAEPEKLWAPWRLEDEALERGKRDAALVWLKEQETAGIDIVSNGEQFREHFVHGFLHHIDGIDWQKMTRMGIRDNRYVVDVPTVTAAVKRKGPVHSEEVRFTRAHTNQQLKFTLPGPMTICDTIADAHYGSRPEMAMAFAELLNQEAKELDALGVDVIQFDEPAFNVFMDDVKEWGVAALHRAIEGLSCTTAVHICYGYGIEENLKWKETLGSEWRQYEEIFPALNDSRIDQVSLECANSKVPLSLLGLLKDKALMVGAIDVASLDVESPEKVADTIKQAAKHVDAETIFPCTNCGMAPLPRSVAVGKLQALGKGAALARAAI